MAGRAGLNAGAGNAVQDCARARAPGRRRATSARRRRGGRGRRTTAWTSPLSVARPRGAACSVRPSARRRGGGAGSGGSPGQATAAAALEEQPRGAAVTMSFFQKLASYLMNQVMVDGLANVREEQKKEAGCRGRAFRRHAATQLGERAQLRVPTCRGWRRRRAAQARTTGCGEGGGGRNLRRPRARRPRKGQ